MKQPIVPLTLYPVLDEPEPESSLPVPLYPRIHNQPE